MDTPNAAELARRLERVIEANHGIEFRIPPEDFEVPIIELDIGSLDLIEWGFELEAEFDLDFGDAELAEVASFSLDDAERWLAEVVSAGVPA